MAGASRDFGVYVIQLKRSAGTPDHAHLPNLYVGQSYYSPEERFEQHRTGYHTASRKAGPHVWRLCPELYVDLPRVRDQVHAEQLEAERARRLAEAGFTVRCDGVVPRVAPARLKPFTVDELRACSELFAEHFSGG